MRLRLTVDGASDDDLRRGFEAAMAVFRAYDTDPLRAAEARYNVEGWDAGGFEGVIEEEDLRLVNAWDEADEAAARACSADWPADRARPRTARLEIVDDEPEEDDFDPREALADVRQFGFFNGERPEDRVVEKLSASFRPGDLGADERKLYDGVILPLLRIWHEDCFAFEAEYKRTRA